MNKKYSHINTASYIGKPLNNTVMYVSKKVAHLIENLDGKEGCLIFAEEGIIVPEKIENLNHFVFTDNPQSDYVEFVEHIQTKKEQLNRKRKYTKTDNNTLIGENVLIGNNAIIEANCLIDHDVQIGDNAIIKYGSVIRNATIGDNFLCNEYANIGSNGFNISRNPEGNQVRIPTLGKVVIGDHVEVGVLSNISAGTAGNTEIHDYVKLDVHVHVGHDAIIHQNCELTAGCIIGGFDVIGEDTFIGLNVSLRNRISIGKRTTIGMAAVVTKSFEDDVVLVGNPAKVLRKKD